MSRSKRKPYIKDRNPLAKRQANQLLRRIQLHEDIPDGKQYRKFFNSWDICDWCWLARSEEEQKKFSRK